VAGRKGILPHPTKEMTLLQSMFREHTELALNQIVQICRRGENENVRLAAATHIIDRGYGKVTTEDQQSAEGLRITLRHIFEGKPKGEK
jgi:hypothetical protein